MIGNAVRDEVLHVLAAITEAWRAGQPDRLNELFHEDMVIAGPGYQVLARGREACVGSYRDFLRDAVVHGYRQSEPTVEMWEAAAVATYDWQMDYEMAGRSHSDSGSDLFVFTRQGGTWLAVWRAVHFSSGS